MSTDSVTAFLSRLTKADLMALARAAEIRGRSSMTKAELIDSLHLEMEPKNPAPATAAPKTSRKRMPNWEKLLDLGTSCGRRTVEGFSCGMPVVRGSNRCSLHGGTDASNLAIPAKGHLGFDTWPDLIRHLRLASYDIDALGLDPVVSEMIWHLANYLYYDYFRVQVEGIENVPLDGPGVLVSNHAGAFIPYDGMMLQLAILNHAPLPRRVRVVGTEILNLLPFLSHLYRKAGAAYASPEDARWVLDRGYLLGVFPEGVPGFQKPHSDAYQLRRLGRGGFVNLAREADAPIVPVAIVGSEDVHPAIYSSKRLAKLFRVFFPQQRIDELAIWVNPIPLPVRWKIRFLAPIETEGVPRDRLSVLELAEQTRGAIQAALDEMVESRTSLF